MYAKKKAKHPMDKMMLGITPKSSKTNDTAKKTPKNVPHMPAPKPSDKKKKSSRKDY